MRLIDADKLHYIRKLFGDSDKSEVVVFAKKIDKAPTVDAVPVIRCKDCKCWGKPNGWNGWCDKHSILVEADDFCSSAERKEE